MMQHVNPLMSYAEMDLPFPEAFELWLASSAAEWKARYFRRDRLDSARSLSDCVRSLLSEGSWSSTNDILCSDLYTLYALWGLVWEQRQLHEMLNTGGEDQDRLDLLLPSRRESLVKVLNKVRAKVLSATEPNYRSRLPEVLLVLEHLHLALHVPLKGLQAFSGKDGEQEAQSVYPILQEWTQTKEARQAMWHAGQLFRAARKLPPESIRDFHVILIYQSSLAFWAYGVITSAFRKKQGRQAPKLSRSVHVQGEKPLVWLDGDQNPAVRRYILFDEGLPAIHDVPGLSADCATHDLCTTRLLQSGSDTMTVGVRILRPPLQNASSFHPPLVNSITRLMSEIGKAARIIERS
jgi:hypothetical protein